MKTQKNDDNNKESTEIKTLSFSRNNSIPLKENNSIINKKEELLFFKNDILKEVKDSITDLNNIYSKKIFEIEKQLEEVYNKYEKSYKQIENITEGITNHKVYQERFSQIEKIQSKLRDSSLNNQIKLKNIDHLLQESISKYDKIILDSILYPGVIGKKNEFQTFHDLIDFLLLNVKKLLNANEKENLENKKTKARIEQTLELFKCQIDSCIDTVENFNQELINYDLKSIFKDIKEIKNQVKEGKNVDNSIMEKIVINEKKLDNINKNITNSLKENADNFNLLLTNTILDVNNNIKNFQDKYDEKIKEFESIKQDVINNKNTLSDINNRFSRYKKDKNFINSVLNHGNKNDIRMNSTLDIGKILHKRESKVKQYISGILKLDDLNRNNSFSKKEENNVKNILSDIEMDLIKDKKKYLNLNINNKNDLNLEDDINDINNNEEYFSPSSNRYKKSLKKEKIENEVLKHTKIPTIKHYNNLKILNIREEKFLQKMKSSTNFLSPMNKYDFVNIKDDINNPIHSQSFSNEDIQDDKQNNKYSRKIFLKKAKEEEKKNENKDERLYNNEKNKILKGKNNKNINISSEKKNTFNSMSIRQKLLSAKERNKSSFSLIEQKELFRQKTKNEINSNTSLFKIDKNNSLNSSKLIRANIISKHSDINFEDKQILHVKDSYKLKKNSIQIKNNLPLKDKDYIQEKVKTFLHFSYKKPNKLNKSAY
jgi:hypothetical protein